ncbi:hypothetical protein [Sinimarinibacterium sp. NLF-5-8]|uniref:hypothetical protein n=1 Tax=Sinimarinibacterium sp. NLF-5-8 TaxID=2698684 RepID=UPI00137C11C7|nr:hypothetical protein [Sinimarinibacterium sp. NLF-5-8]QHS08694.1 hypothetical protein GT972_00080 [Sinimarinibacterium sp. NLF-5-8]
MEIPVAVIIAICALVFVLLTFGFTRNTKEHRLVIQLPKPDAKVIELIDQRRKLEAVKLYRQMTATSLLEAKRVVDHYALIRGSAA